MNRFTSILSKITDINTKSGFMLHTLFIVGVFTVLYVSYVAGLFDGASGFTYAEY